MAGPADPRYDRALDAAMVSRKGGLARTLLPQAAGILLAALVVAMAGGLALGQTSRTTTEKRRTSEPPTVPQFAAKTATTGTLKMTGLGPASATPFAAKTTTTTALKMFGLGPASTPPFMPKIATTATLKMTGATAPK